MYVNKINIASKQRFPVGDQPSVTYAGGDFPYIYLILDDDFFRLYVGQTISSYRKRIQFYNPFNSDGVIQVGYGQGEVSQNYQQIDFGKNNYLLGHSGAADGSFYPSYLFWNKGHVLQFDAEFTGNFNVFVLSNVKEDTDFSFFGVDFAPYTATNTNGLPLKPLSFRQTFNKTRAEATAFATSFANASNGAAPNETAYSRYGEQVSELSCSLQPDTALIISQQQASTRYLNVLVKDLGEYA